MPVPGLSLLGLKRIRGFASILRYINPTIILLLLLLKDRPKGATRFQRSRSLRQGQIKVTP